MENNNGVSLIMAVWNQLGYTKLAVQSISGNAGTVPFELIVVDNGSRPEVRAYFDSLRPGLEVRYIRNEKNHGPIRAVNQGIGSSRYPYIGVMHNDVVITEKGWLDRIVTVMESDKTIGIAGLAGRKEIYKDGCVNEMTLKHNLDNEDLNAPMRENSSEVAVVDGLCFVMTRRLIDRIGGLDETYGYMHCYDLDVSLASRAAGFRNVVVGISAMHIGNGGMTRKLKEYKDMVRDDYGLLRKNCRILSKKWKGILPLKVP